jgi:hypothetical protein
MIPDDVRQDAASLGREFNVPPSVHEEVYTRIAQRRPNVYRQGVTRREYATELAVLIRDDPMVAHLFKQRQDIRIAYAVAAAIAAAKG